jgi:hypothetical protein
MPHGNTLSRLLIASLAAGAIAAPAAVAKPIDPLGTATSPAPISQEMRTEAAKEQAKSSTPVGQEMRTEAAKDPSRAPITRPAPGAPTWPMHPRVLTPPQSTTTFADNDGGGVDAPIVGLIIAGTLALGGSAIVVASRRSTRVAH